MKVIREVFKIIYFLNKFWIYIDIIMIINIKRVIFYCILGMEIYKILDICKRKKYIFILFFLVVNIWELDEFV